MRQLAITAAMTVILGTTAAEARRPAPFLTLSDPVAPPRGFPPACVTDVADCTAAATGSDAPHAGDDRRLLAYINRRVNNAVRQRREAVGRIDWSASGVGARASGDCKNLAVEKRAELIDRGYPTDRLFIAVVYGRAGVGLHAVLVARTQDGDVVLDSRSSAIAPWYHSPYVWISAQSPVLPTSWYAVADPSSVRS